VKNILIITPVKHIHGVFPRLSELGKIVYLPDPKSLSDFEAVESNIEIIFTNPNKLKINLDKRILEIFPNLKIICTASTGTSHIDLDIMADNNIKVISLKNEISVLEKVSSTAELAFSLSCLAIRNLTNAIHDVKQGGWDYEKFIGRQWNELNVGVVGLGRLGKMYANYANAFGASVTYFDPYVENNNYKREINLQKLFRDMDIISLHIHAYSDTYGLINDQLLSYAKDNLILINTSRGEIVEESSIINWLKKNKSSKYLTDVIINETEGKNNSPIYMSKNTLENLVITPHIGGMSKAAQKIAYNRAVDLLENNFIVKHF
jgi:D-3-phosphoglycerate dehydrogenase / 2-oxoglutarate reductase